MKIIFAAGGGQLGRMLGHAANLLNIKVVFLDKGLSPAKQVASSSDHVDGSFGDASKIVELAKKADVLTVEIEHVDVDALESVADIVDIQPKPATIRLIQDKYTQKVHLRKRGCPVSDFEVVESNKKSISKASEHLGGFPLMLKSRTMAYDGRGNFVLRSEEQIPEALNTLGDRPLYAERWCPFKAEIAVMVVRSVDGTVLSYPVVETVHKDNICHLVFAPLRIGDSSVASGAQSIAEEAIKTLDGAGVFGVEMFLMEDGTIYINEIAPRPHNSGHYTIEACLTSQYANHLRAILSLPLGPTSLIVPSAVMLNLIGASSSMSEMTVVVKEALEVPGANVHLYGKEECRKGRKMGHITIVADSDEQRADRLRPLLLALPSSSNEDEVKLYAPSPLSSSHSSHRPLVGVIMGSDSDLPTMLPASNVLRRFQIPFELTIVSAHRTPDRLFSYAKNASSRGLRVIISGAGGAAHLPGMVAALTPLPVIGVPVKGSSLDGVDSLYSIVQMPRGIPVATVAINNAMNAGLLAVRMLSTGMPRLIEDMEDYMTEQEAGVMGKVERLERVGWEAYGQKSG